jgi:hypothetical protein
MHGFYEYERRDSYSVLLTKPYVVIEIIGLMIFLLSIIIKL